MEADLIEPKGENRTYKIKDGDASTLDWDSIENDKKEGWTITFYHQPSWSKKRYEYTEEEARKMLWWQKIRDKAETELHEFEQKGIDNVATGDCPRCKQKLKYDHPLCFNCGVSFCRYCFALTDVDRYTCECPEIIREYYNKIEDARDEIMKFRQREYDDWLSGADALKEKVNE